ncbi:MAG: hypothetical protein ACON4M_09210 [Crocinitomicaceae bacterium]
MKKIILLVFLLFTTISFSQEIVNDSISDKSKSKLISVGAKLGVPNVISFNGEIILPILGNHLAPFIDYGALEIELDGTNASLKYSEYGLNFYFGNNGKGFYASAGKGQLNTDITFNNLTFEENGVTQKGSATTGLDINSLNLKLGVKTGGFVFLRIEVGYGMGTIPDRLNFTATSNGITETFSEEIPSIPGLSSDGLLIGNIGLGISF